MFFLKRNLPTWERAARVIAKAAIAAAVARGLTPGGVIMWVTLASAASLVLTVFVGFCPACAMVGLCYLEQQLGEPKRN